LSDSDGSTVGELDITPGNEVELQLAELIDMINLIDVCCGRGTFKGDEMETVGRLRNRIKRFVDIYNPPEELFVVQDRQEENDETETEKESI